MSNCFRLTCLLVVATTAFCQLQVLEIAHSDQHFANIHRHDHSLRGLYDPSMEPDTSAVVARLFEDLAANELLIANNFSLGLVDISKAPFFKSHYSIHNQSQFLYFVKNQMQIMMNFNHLVLNAMNGEAEYQQLLAATLEYVKGRFARISTPLRSVEQFLHALEEHKTIGIFFGPEGSEFNVYKNFAASHIDFNFYHVSNAELGREIFYLKSKIEKPESPFFALIRSAEVVNEFDPHPVVLTTNLRSVKTLDGFFIPEHQPKLLEEANAGSLGTRLYQTGEKLVLYVWDGANDEGLKVFEQAVIELPKKLIYSRVSVESPFMGSFLQFFVVGGSSMTANTLYVLHVNQMRVLEVLPMQGDFDKNNIMKFVFKFYQENLPNFEKEMHEAFRNRGQTAEEPKASVADLGVSEEL